MVIIGGNALNVNLRTVYDAIFPSAPTDETVVRFIIDTGVEIGSSSPTQYAIDTGSWPVGMAPINLLVRGYAQGRGGSRVNPNNMGGDGEDGSPAINMGYDLTIEDVTGLIGGGGGAGGSSGDGTQYATGGGGAGIPGGYPGGTRTTGYPGYITVIDGLDYESGAGGDIAQPGVDSEIDGVIDFTGGAAGAAIVKNGYTLTITAGASNIIGSILA